MKTTVLALLLAATAFAQSGWRSPRDVLVTRPDEQEAAIKHLKLPADCIVLIVSLDCSDCVKPMEQLRGVKAAVIIIRARATSVEEWRKKRPTLARVITIDSEEKDEDLFGLGVFGIPTVLKIEGGRIVGAAERLPKS